MSDRKQFRLPDGRLSLRDWKIGQNRCPSTDVATSTLTRYGFSRVARWQREENRFSIFDRCSETMQKTCCVYAFVVNDEIVRIGSSKGKLGSRCNGYQSDISKALAGDFISKNGKLRSTKQDEIELWIDALTKHGIGEIWARQGTTFKSPISDEMLNAYQDEESFLIARHQPRQS